MSHPPQSQHIVPIWLYTAVWIALMVLLAATVTVAFVGLGHFNVVVAMAIAAIKTALVVMFFMHMRYDRPTVWVFGAAALLWLGILFTLSLSDYLTRGWLPVSQGWTQRAIIPPPPNANLQYGPADQAWPGPAAPPAKP